MKLKPIPASLGIRPDFWLRFHFMSAHAWWHERESHKPGRRVAMHPVDIHVLSLSAYPKVYAFMKKLSEAA